VKLLKHPSDLRSLSFLTIALVLLFASLALQWQALSVLLYTLSLIAGVTVVFLISLLNHNHQHHPTFYQPALNRTTNILISLCIGAPSTRLHLVHHFNHHRYYQSGKDWSSYKNHSKGRGLFRILYYFFSASREIAKNRNNIEAPENLINQQKVERITLWIFIGFALWLNPGVFLGLILPSWIGGLGLLLTSNLLNHDQCELESKYNHSRSFLGKFENWFFLNNGFHSAHHEKPHLHWTQLPDLYRTHFEQHTDEKLKQKSFVVYFAKYVFKNEI
jgi:fatty acid desaturase